MCAVVLEVSSACCSPSLTLESYSCISIPCDSQNSWNIYGIIPCQNSLCCQEHPYRPNSPLFSWPTSHVPSKASLPFAPNFKKKHRHTIQKSGDYPKHTISLRNVDKTILPNLTSHYLYPLSLSHPQNSSECASHVTRNPIETSSGLPRNLATADSSNNDRLHALAFLEIGLVVLMIVAIYWR